MASRKEENGVLGLPSVPFGPGFSVDGWQGTISRCYLWGKCRGWLPRAGNCLPLVGFRGGQRRIGTNKRLPNMDSSQSECLGRGLNLPKTSPNDKDGASIRAIFDLLDKGEKEINLDDKHKEIILVLGNLGSSKSAFMKWVARDNANLLSKEVEEGTEEYKIEYINRIFNSTKNSETPFPELVVDTKANIAYYDCTSGILDTGRSASNDIAKAYFIQKVLDRAESIKIIFTISYRSVIKGKDRRDFLQLLRYFTELVKDFEVFRNSIGMVVTEVDNQYVKQGANTFLVDDNEVEGDIADFLLGVKQFLEENLKVSNISEEDRKYHGNSEKIIDVILEKNGEQYTKIGLFRRPDEPGLVGNNYLLQEGEKKLQRMLHKNLQYTRKDLNDFNYMVSEKSKQVITDLVEEISNNLWSYFSDVSQQILKCLTDITGRMHREIKSFTNNIFIDDVSLSEGKRLSTQLNDGYNIVSDLIEKIKNSIDTEDLAMKVNNIVTSLNINVPNESIMHIAKQGKYLKFLLTVADIELNRPWEKLFRSTLTDLSESRKTVYGEINEAAQKINCRILSDLNEIAEAIQEHYNRKMKLMEIQQLPDILATEYDVMTKMMVKVENLTTTKELVKAIHDCSNVLDIILPKKNMLDITSQGRYLEFLQNVNEEVLEKVSSSWIDPFQTIVKYLHQSQKWYIFLNALYDKFSEYEIQKDRQKYNVASLDDWGKTDKPQGIAITSTSYNEFLNKIAKYKITKQDDVKNITLTELQLEELNHVLNLTLKHKLNVKCEDSSMIVTGSYISMLEMKKSIINSGNPDESCNIFSLEKIRNSSIFALNTIFIDIYPTFNSSFVTIIAPKWEILDQMTINVSGSKGESHMEPHHLLRPRTRSKAANGFRPGAKGADGKPGGPGGIFLGIGNTFVNGGNLAIEANGGEGGAAQHGGDGYSGKNGRSAEMPSSVHCKRNCNEVDGFKCETIYFTHFPDLCMGWTGICHPGYDSSSYKIFGKPGEKGGDGGNGGRGGKGGEPGDIIMFELNGDSVIEQIIDKGNDGENGRGGRGGFTGSEGDDIIVYCKVSAQTKEQTLDKRIKKSKGPSGSNGIDGANTVGQLYPKPPNVLKDPAKIVNKYKNYLREHIMDRFTRIPHIQFLEKLDSNDKFNSIYNTVGLIDEFEGLEKQFHGLNKDVDFSPFYRSLLSRISEYSKRSVGDEKSNQHKKVLNFLYTATLGKIYNLKDDSESNLIVNIGGYLGIIKKEIETLRDLQRANNKAEIINKYQERFKDNLDKKIEEAKSIIEKQITPEMGDINKDMDNKIDLLIAETIELQKKAEEEKETLIKKKQELERAMAFRGLFSCFSIFSQVLSFFGPVGAAVGSVIGATSSVAESLVLDKQQQTLKIPPGVVSELKTLGEQIKSVREKKIAYLDKLLKEISQEIGNNPKKLGDMSKKITDLKNRLNKVKENTYDFKEMKTIESELKQELKTKEGQLKIK
ncbi:hypothetical protein AVEN_46587-1 [Araneus ventricosus]|uniref:Uncharacterized protein n=1 Tax=Araneus ventricosus TaxID=182803 RepID=A0A4Y2MLG3_ARAVE|nr:hypothetical protein AVEN_46587-1 [Araneus ventricosus]